jgi:HD-GYP domain-containing protein (c-di-GMP phosphodiesterase class II)
VEAGPADVEVHRGELFAALSLALDLGTGQPLEHALRSCLLAVELADRAGLGDDERSAVYHLALLHSIGCTADSPEAAARYGDDITVRAEHAPIDGSSQRELMAFMWRASGPGEPPWSRARRFAGALAGGAAAAREGLRAHCEVAERLASLLGLSEAVADGLWFVFERWDGKGFPRGIGGEEIPRAARVMHIARDLDVLAAGAEAGAAERVIRDRAGGAYDPALAEHADGLLASLPAGSAWEAVVSAPEAGAPLRGEALDRACAAVAYFADLKSVHTLEHSTGVAELAEAAAWRSDMGEVGAGLLRRAGLVHDLGRVAVSSAVWDKPGALTEPEWERVRLHPYFTGRALARAERMAPVASVAAAHHERLDGSGYPAGTTAPALGDPERLLAAADAFQSMIEPRAHRPAHPLDEAAAELEAEVERGRLDPAAVDAVLAAAGQRARRRRTRRSLPAGLTERELEVLRLIAHGHSNRQAAAELGVSPKTVGHHVQHVYSKIGVSTRAGAAVFAMEHDLLRR